MVRIIAVSQATVLSFILINCSNPASQPSAKSESTAETSNTIIRSGDIDTRGYTEDDFPRVQKLAEGVYSYEQLRSAADDGKMTTVSMFVVTNEGVLVADGQGNPKETQRLVETIAATTDKPITHVIISSDHGDHTAGNVSFPDDVTFVAHPTSKTTLETSANNPNRSPNAPPVIMPTEIVEEQKTFLLGGYEIQVLFLGRAHTGGDLVVYLPKEKILFMSETYLLRIFPAMRSAYPSEWVAMIERAQSMDVETYIPGHGFVESPEIMKEELEVYRQALVQVIAEANRLHAQGLDAEAAAEQADFGALEEWTLRNSQAARAISKVYEEIEGKLP